MASAASELNGQQFGHERVPSRNGRSLRREVIRPVVAASLGQQQVDLLVRADADPQAVAPAGVVHVAHQDALGLQSAVQVLRVRRRVAAPDEVGLRVDAREAELAQLGRQPLARGEDGGARAVEPRRGRRSPPTAPAIDSASQLYESFTLASSLDHLRLGDDVAEPQPGQRVRLARACG